ncbi:AbrB family transcriptional regulator [Pacificoceanicola onchidii]|uniref:AbrB family transcriptional regulator n=1 Tax=Pacificoceanicola onchidii TaxID=2562685 RepID=UPI0010A3C480|nr:AbrB family transcriptional regulator [Pacificoceanicola onchidii]
MFHAKGALRTGLITCVLLVFGALGGWCAALLAVPMPWMLGSLLATALLVLWVKPTSLTGYSFPLPLRTGFIALIGVMIGAQLEPSFLSMMAELALSVSMLALFVGLTHAGNMLIFRRLGGYDRATAFYAATPGGLMESILLGESAGADLKILTAQQFLRIIFVITLVPSGLSLWLGHPVGSAAGLNLGDAPEAPLTAVDFGVISLIGLTGLGIARLIRLPAGHLTGPLLLAAAFSVAGVLDLHVPFWLVSTAQVVIGVSLGLRFNGMNARLLRNCAGLSFVSVVFMLGLGAGFASVLHVMTELPFLHLFISYAPGGVTEMSVIALSLAANPAFVSLHHVLRILMTVLELTVLSKLVDLKR